MGSPKLKRELVLTPLAARMSQVAGVGVRAAP